jgi:ABC-type multidrug transport system fused ATPase/permease subunit
LNGTSTGWNLVQEERRINSYVETTKVSIYVVGGISWGQFFLMVQIAGDLLLPNITSDIINNGIAKNNIGYIWNLGLKMLLVSLVGLIGAGVNVFFLLQLKPKKLVINYAVISSEKYRSCPIMNLKKFGEASLITRTTNDVIQIQKRDCYDFTHDVNVADYVSRSRIYGLSKTIRVNRSFS